MTSPATAISLPSLSLIGQLKFVIPIISAIRAVYRTPNWSDKDSVRRWLHSVVGELERIAAKTDSHVDDELLRLVRMVADNDESFEFIFSLVAGLDKPEVDLPPLTGIDRDDEELPQNSNSHNRRMRRLGIHRANIAAKLSELAAAGKLDPADDLQEIAAQVLGAIEDDANTRQAWCEEAVTGADREAMLAFIVKLLPLMLKLLPLILLFV
jgi:hypothetical protein